MQLLANVCDMPVVLPAEDSDAVVLGAAVLGRFAAEMAGPGGEREMKEMSGKEQADLFWKIMVGTCFLLLDLWTVDLSGDVQVEMTPTGTLLAPRRSLTEKRLLDAKYKIFKEMIELQKRWRQEMEDALTSFTEAIGP
jgi:hypothetical protein